MQLAMLMVPSLAAADERTRLRQADRVSVQTAYCSFRFALSVYQTLSFGTDDLTMSAYQPAYTTAHHHNMISTHDTMETEHKNGQVRGYLAALPEDGVRVWSARIRQILTLHEAAAITNTSEQKQK